MSLIIKKGEIVGNKGGYGPDFLYLLCIHIIENRERKQEIPSCQSKRRENRYFPP